MSRTLRAMEIEDRVYAAIARTLYPFGAYHAIRPDHRLVEDLCADSLDLVQIVMAVEDELGHEIPDEIAEGWRTVQDILDYARGTT